MSRYELSTHKDDFEVHVGWDQQHGMFYLEAQNRGFPGEYVLEADLDDLVIQAERYGDIPQTIREDLLREESRHFAEAVDFVKSAEHNMEWEDDLDLADEFDFFPGNESER